MEGWAPEHFCLMPGWWVVCIFLAVAAENLHTTPRNEAQPARALGLILAGPEDGSPPSTDPPTCGHATMPMPDASTSKDACSGNEPTQALSVAMAKPANEADMLRPLSTYCSNLRLMHAGAMDESSASHSKKTSCCCPFFGRPPGCFACAPIVRPTAIEHCHQNCCNNGWPDAHAKRPTKHARGNKACSIRAH